MQRPGPKIEKIRIFKGRFIHSVIHFHRSLKCTGQARPCSRHWECTVDKTTRRFQNTNPQRSPCGKHGAQHMVGSAAEQERGAQKSGWGCREVWSWPVAGKGPCWQVRFGAAVVGAGTLWAPWALWAAKAQKLERRVARSKDHLRAIV